MLRYVFSMCCLLSLTWPVMAQIGTAAPSARPSGTPTAPQPPPPDKPVMPPVSTVINAFIAATGGQAAYEAMRGLERRYTWAIGDDTGATQVRARPGGAFLLDMTMRDSAWHEGQGSNGIKTWLEDAAGECFPAPEIVGVQLQMEHDPTAWLHLDRYVRISAVSNQVELLGRPHWRLILVPLKGRSWYAYFDVESGLLSRFEFARPSESGRLITVERKYSDWKSVGSIALPHAIEEQSVAGTVAMTLREAHTKTFEPGTFALSTCAEAAFNRPSDELPAHGDYHAALIDMIGPTLVDMQGQQMPSSILADQPDVLLYFTAKWCGPCRRFTPKLVEFFNKNAGKHDFMVVVVSSDRSKDQLAQYLKDYKMPFPAVPFERRDTSGLKKKYGARGIPNLVWLDGQDEMVQSSYEKGTYVGPDKVLSAFSKHMGL